MTVLDTALRGGGSLVAPVVYRLAARLEQVPVEEMLDDPATAAFVLRSAQSLFGLALVVNHFQLGLELEAESPLPRDGDGRPAADADRNVDLSPDTAPLNAAVAVVARLSSELHGAAQILGVLTGPATLTGLHGSSEGVGELYAAMARRYADAGAAGVLLVERPGADRPAAIGTLTELGNICRYYAIPSILVTPSAAPPEAPVDASLGAADLLPAALLRQPPDESAARQWTGHRGLLLTDGEVPPDADPETVLDWLDVLGRAQLGVRR